MRANWKDRLAVTLFAVACVGGFGSIILAFVTSDWRWFLGAIPFGFIMSRLTAENG